MLLSSDDLMGLTLLTHSPGWRPSMTSQWSFQEYILRERSSIHPLRWQEVDHQCHLDVSVEFRRGYFYRGSISGTNTWLPICQNFHWKLTWAPVLTRLQSQSHWKNISTPTFPEFSTTFSTPVLFKMRGGEDEIRPPEDILLAPLSAHLTTPLPFPFLSSSLERFVCSSPFLPFVCIFPEASFNKAVMMQIYFGWGHVCLLGLIIAQPPLSFFLLSPSSLFTGSSFDTNRIPVANEWV